MSFFKKIFWDSWNFYKKCSICNKPETSESNYKRLKYLILGSTAGGATVGAAALPLIGFGAGGVVAGSAAASWQSSIGLVVAGSLFATLQSLGATGLGVLLFGAVGTGLGVLGSIATRLGWCTCGADRIQQDKTLYDFIKRLENAIKQTVWNAWNYYMQCPVCNKPAICELNSKRLGILMISITATCDANPEKFAASWRKAVSSVADGKLFTTLQSLGVTGPEKLFFSSTDTSSEVFRSIAASLGFCSSHEHHADDKKPTNDIERLLTKDLNSSETNSNQDGIECVGGIKQRPAFNSLHKEKLEIIEHFSKCSKCNKSEACVLNLNKLRKKVAENISAMMSLFDMLDCVEARDKTYTLLYGKEDLAIRVLTSLTASLDWCTCTLAWEIQKMLIAFNDNN